MTGGRRRGSHRRINYIYKKNKKTLFFLFSILHQLASSKHESAPDSWARKYRTRSHFLEIHLENNNSKKVQWSSTLSKSIWLLRWRGARALQISSVSPLDSPLGVQVQEPIHRNQLQNKENLRVANSPLGICLEARVVWFGEKRSLKLTVFLDWFKSKKHICRYIFLEKHFSYITIFRH